MDMLFRAKFFRAYLMAPLLVLLGATPAESATSSVQYTYDKLGRVTAALYDNGTCVPYTYDANGNRTAQAIVTSGAPTSPVWGSGVWGCFPWTPP
jgi:YD repeat-containing protein